jgi:hypothetical protein
LSLDGDYISCHQNLNSTCFKVTLLKYPLSFSELDREANIAQNRLLLEQLGIREAITDLGASSRKLSAKPVQPAKRIKRERDFELPRRQSRRLLTKSQSKDETLTPEERAIQEVYDSLTTRYALSILYILGGARRVACQTGGGEITSPRTSKGSQTASS